MRTSSLNYHNLAFQRGNALFLILIAVALFAALSYAITQSGRSSGSINKEETIIEAGQITEYAAGIRTAVTRMILSGTPAHSLCYDPPGGCAGPADYQVFNPNGGGETWQCPPADASNAPSNMYSGWLYRGIQHHSGDNGFYIKDVGTNTNVSGRDAFAYLPYVTLPVCQAINKGLGLDQTPVPDTNFHKGAQVATYDETQNVITSNPGSAFACTGVDSDNSPYNYYHALVEQ